MSRRLYFLLAVLSFGLSLAACAPTDPNEKFIQGTWTAGGDLGDGHSWYLEWTFANGSFDLTGYPPLHQAGKYRVTASQADNLTLELYNQQGDLPTDDRSITVVIDRTNNTLTIDGQGPFTLSQPVD